MLKKILEYISDLWYPKISIRNKGSDNMLSFFKRENESIHNELSVIDIAQFFSKKESMSHKKLQKLVYYAYAWYIALYNEDSSKIEHRLCNDAEFEAWVHGPVCRKLYNICSDSYGFVPQFDGKLNPLLCGEIKKFLENIYKTFGKYTGDELESMTHLEQPWQNARDNLPASIPSNKLILESDMFCYYNNLK